MLDKVDEQQYNSQSSVATDVVTITDDEEIDIRQLDNNKEISCNKKIRFVHFIIGYSNNNCIIQMGTKL